MLETYKEVSEVMSPSSLGIGPDNRFTRRELQRHYVTVTRAIKTHKS